MQRVRLVLVLTKLFVIAPWDVSVATDKGQAADFREFL